MLTYKMKYIEDVDFEEKFQQLKGHACKEEDHNKVD